MSLTRRMRRSWDRAQRISALEKLVNENARLRRENTGLKRLLTTLQRLPQEGQDAPEP